jgi:anti-anti-sigma factor
LARSIAAIDLGPTPVTGNGDVVWYLSITEEDLGSVLVLGGQGRVFSATVADLRHTLACDVSGRRGVILDLSGVDYVNGAGLHIMETAAARMRSLGCELVVCGLCPVVRTAFELAGSIEHLTIESSRESAVARLGGGPPA